LEVNWQLSGLEGYPSGQLAVFETETNDTGRFHIPAWGPKKSPASVTVYGDQPVARFLKRGYEPLIVFEQIDEPGGTMVRAKPHMYPGINGKEILLVPVREFSIDAYAVKTDRFVDSVLKAFVQTRCDKSHVPKLFAELDAMKQLFERAGIQTLLTSQKTECH
jgi:hypothetical protein